MERIMSEYSTGSLRNVVSEDGMQSKYKGYCDVMCYMMTICLGMCMITGNKFFSFAIIALAAASIFTIEAIIPIEFMLFLAPILFDSGLAIGIDKIIFLIITVGQIISVFFLRKSLINKRYLMIAAWIILAVIASGIHSRFNQPWGTASVLVVEIVTFIFYSQYCLSRPQVYELVDRFSKVCMVMMVFFVIQIILHPTSVDNRLTVAEDLNINHFAMTISQISIFLLTYGLLSSKKRKKNICFVLYVVGLIMLLFTGTRSSTIAIVCSSIFVYIQASKISGREQGFQRVILLGLLVLVLAVVSNTILGSNDFLKDRFTLTNLVSTSGSGRFPSLMTEFTEIIPDNFWLGVGPSAYAEVDAVYQYGHWYFSSHNVIGSMLTQLGIIGSVPLVILCINIIKRLNNGLKIDVRFLIPLGLVITCLINGIGEQIFNSRMYWFALSFSILLLNSMDVYQEA